MDDCVFCNIVNKTIDSQIAFENEFLIVIKDILPKAPVHFLVIPKRHIVSVNELTEADKPLMGEMVLAAKEMARQFGVAETGYKLSINVGRDGGMVVSHLHMHVMGGKKLPE